MRRARQTIRWILVASLAGCGLTTTEPDLAEQLVGDWSWLDSAGGIAGLTLTPETDPHQAMQDLVAALQPRRVEVHRPRLEDIFIELVEGDVGRGRDRALLRASLQAGASGVEEIAP